MFSIVASAHEEKVVASLFCIFIAVGVYGRWCVTDVIEMFVKHYVTWDPMDMKVVNPSGCGLELCKITHFALTVQYPISSTSCLKSQ